MPTSKPKASFKIAAVPESYDISQVFLTAARFQSEFLKILDVLASTPINVPEKPRKGKKPPEPTEPIDLSSITGNRTTWVAELVRANTLLGDSFPADAIYWYKRLYDQLKEIKVNLFSTCAPTGNILMVANTYLREGHHSISIANILTIISIMKMLDSENAMQMLVKDLGSDDLSIFTPPTKTMDIMKPLLKYLNRRHGALIDFGAFKDVSALLEGYRLAIAESIYETANAVKSYDRIVYDLIYAQIDPHVTMLSRKRVHSEVLESLFYDDLPNSSSMLAFMVCCGVIDGTWEAFGKAMEEANLNPFQERVMLLCQSSALGRCVISSLRSDEELVEAAQISAVKARDSSAAPALTILSQYNYSA